MAREGLGHCHFLDEPFLKRFPLPQKNKTVLGKICGSFSAYVLLFSLFSQRAGAPGSGKCPLPKGPRVEITRSGAGANVPTPQQHTSPTILFPLVFPGKNAYNGVGAIICCVGARYSCIGAWGAPTPHALPLITSASLLYPMGERIARGFCEGRPLVQSA